MSEQDKIGNLQSVSLMIDAGRAPSAKGLLPEAVGWEFIYGIGPAGLSPFEQELSGRAAGDEVVVRSPGIRLAELFGHLAPPLGRLVEEAGELRLHVAVQAVRPADPREVVRALADLANCGSCCGHH